MTQYLNVRSMLPHCTQLQAIASQLLVSPMVRGATYSLGRDPCHEQRPVMYVLGELYVRSDNQHYRAYSFDLATQYRRGFTMTIEMLTSRSLAYLYEDDAVVRVMQQGIRLPVCILLMPRGWDAQYHILRPRMPYLSDHLHSVLFARIRTTEKLQ